MNLRQTHTFAVLELSKKSFNEIKDKLIKVGYEDYSFVYDWDNNLTIDMHGIGVKIEKQS